MQIIMQLFIYSYVFFSARISSYRNYVSATRFRLFCNLLLLIFFAAFCISCRYRNNAVCIACEKLCYCLFQFVCFNEPML